jgi:hypothetical protein
VKPLASLALALALAACGDDDEAGDPDAAPPGPDATPPDAGPPDANPLAPMSLAATGLYADFAAETLADGVLEYAPRFALWSDGAGKRRWVKLPDGATIDTSNVDFWVYPEGTKLWKEFTRDGVRVETRLLYKTGPASTDWFMMAYAWNAEQTAAVAAPLGARDALGTEHDIPEPSDCEKCHRAVPDVLLGFSAIQLAHGGPGVTLADLVADGRLSAPPAVALDLPGDATAQAALGYLHANCGTCHNDYSDVMDKVDMRLMLTVGTLGAVDTTPAYATSVGIAPNRAIVGVTSLIEPGDPDASAVHVRMNQRGPQGMPPLASELVDTDAVAAIDAWINSL